MNPIEALAEALKAFLHTCEYHKSPPMEKPCGEPAVYYHAGYEGEIWWACKKHASKRFRWVGDFEIDERQVAARAALKDIKAFHDAQAQQEAPRPERAAVPSVPVPVRLPDPDGLGPP